MKITYIGPIDAVDIPALQMRVQRGQTVDVPDADGDLLIAQADWVAAADPKKGN